MASMPGSHPVMLASAPPPPRQSKKWVSRTWLFVINALLAISSAFAIYVGAVAIKYAKLANAKATSSGSSSFEVNIRDSAISFIVCGVFLLVTSIAGCTGGIVRNNWLLSFYVGALVIDFVLVVGYGSYSIYAMNKRGNAWRNLSLDTWTAAANVDKDLAQWAFNCCGYSGYQDNAYTGSPLIQGETVN
ncbi:hypothetical protein HK405_014489, partial [Cladochytrium tenue]